MPAAQVSEALYRHGRPWLEEARLFDVYTGDQVPPGKRSLAFRLSNTATEPSNGGKGTTTVSLNGF